MKGARRKAKGARQKAQGTRKTTDRSAGTRFFFYAKGSLAELSTQADIAAEIELLDAAEPERWMCECRELSRMLAALIRRRLES